MENQTPLTVPRTPVTIPSRVIARLTNFITVIYSGGFLIEFFSRGVFKPISQMGIVYTSLLTAYAGEKELRRWNGLIEENAQGGKGEYIVSLWFLFYTFCWLFTTFKPVYKIPAELATACISILTILFGSKASKRFYQGKLRKRLSLPKSFDSPVASLSKSLLEETLAAEPSALIDPATEETQLIKNNRRADIILDYLKKNGKIDCETTAALLGVSKRTASRLLGRLANEGRINWIGKWESDREGYYVLPEGTSS